LPQIEQRQAIRQARWWLGGAVWLRCVAGKKVYLGLVLARTDSQNLRQSD